MVVSLGRPIRAAMWWFIGYEMRHIGKRVTKMIIMWLMLIIQIKHFVMVGGVWTLKRRYRERVKDKILYQKLVFLVGFVLFSHSEMPFFLGV